MTAAQIEEFERLNREAHPAPWTWAGDTIHAGDSMVPGARPIIALVKDVGYNDQALMTIARKVLPRLLEERKRLLAFAKRMDETLDAHLYQLERLECAAAIDFSQADPGFKK